MRGKEDAPNSSSKESEFSFEEMLKKAGEVKEKILGFKSIIKKKFGGKTPSLHEIAAGTIFQEKEVSEDSPSEVFTDFTSAASDIFKQTWPTDLADYFPKAHNKVDSKLQSGSVRCLTQTKNGEEVHAEIPSSIGDLLQTNMKLAGLDRDDIVHVDVLRMPSYKINMILVVTGNGLMVEINLHENEPPSVSTTVNRHSQTPSLYPPDAINSQQFTPEESIEITRGAIEYMGNITQGLDKIRTGRQAAAKTDETGAYTVSQKKQIARENTMLEEQSRNTEALNKLPGFQAVKHGNELPYIQLSQGALQGDYVGESTTMLIVNQQGEVIAKVYEGFFDQANQNQEYGDMGNIDIDSVRFAVRKRLDDIGLSSYAIVFDNENDLEYTRKPEAVIDTDLEDLTKGRNIYDFQGDTANFGDYTNIIGERIDVLNSNKGGIAELSLLANDPVFQERFVQTQTAVEGVRLAALDIELNKTVERQLRPLIEQSAMQRLGISDIDEARKQGKVWGDALKQTTEVSLSIGGETKTVPIDNMVDVHNKTTITGARSYLKAELQPDYDGRVTEAKTALAEAETRQRDILVRLKQEVADRRDDPEFQAAMELWGRSPDSKGQRGVDGRGLNAGVIHYFEYRADKQKNGRYKNSDTAVSVQGFIDYSKKVKELIDHPNTAPAIQAARVIKDDQGQQRIHILTKDGDKVVGFKNSGDQMRVITIIPGGNEKILEKDVLDELNANPDDPKETARLNHLGTGRKEISVGE
ncbi:hypothetical protein HGB07_01265 [Candidatus Roizmanbacteria bacterium]|nr:hypothetical protein [Candidatus Roizmanbacteria bacterium]